jgi:hypothetical protein
MFTSRSNGWRQGIQRLLLAGRMFTAEGTESTEQVISTVMAFGGRARIGLAVNSLHLILDF